MSLLYTKVPESTKTAEDYWKTQAATKLALSPTSINWTWMNAKDWTYAGLWPTSAAGATSIAPSQTAANRLRVVAGAANSSSLIAQIGYGSNFNFLIPGNDTTKKWMIGGRFSFPGVASFTNQTAAHIVLVNAANGQLLLIGYEGATSTTKLIARAPTATARTYTSTVAPAATMVDWYFRVDGASTGYFSVSGEAEVSSNGTYTIGGPLKIWLYCYNAAAGTIVSDIEIEHLFVAAERE